jgi:hypothetical protein
MTWRETSETEGAEDMTGSVRRLGICLIGPMIVSSIVALPGTGLAQEADRAYVNGTVYTVDESFSTGHVYLRGR